MFYIELIYPKSLSEELRDSLATMYDDGCNWVGIFKPDCFAPGIWAGTEGAIITWEWKNAPSEQFIITRVDMDKKIVVLTPLTPAA